MSKIVIDDTALKYKSMLKWRAISYGDIKQIYMRIEEARTTIGCCPHYFETPYLMIRTDEKTYQILGESKEKVKEYLQQIKEKNPAVEVGYKK